MEGIISEQIKNMECVLNNKLAELSNKFDTKMMQNICHANAISALHQKTFGKYKNINQGKDVVLVGAGPTLKDYQPIKDAIHIGVNRTFQFDKINLDYLFLLDYLNVKQYIDEANNYRKDKCVKFYGLFSEHNHAMHIPDSEVFKANALRYYISNSNFDLNEQFNYSIETKTLGCFWSVIFQAAQFALYTNPKRIYLAGCDCTYDVHYDNNTPLFVNKEAQKQHIQRGIDGWKKLKEFASIYYPETEIISINPVGLKGLFKDIYTQGK